MTLDERAKEIERLPSWDSAKILAPFKEVHIYRASSRWAEQIAHSEGPCAWRAVGVNRRGDLVDVLMEVEFD